MKKFMSRFWKDEDGVITVETVIAVPFVALAFFATYVFFDLYRVNTASQKAAYIVADSISRQTEPVNVTFIEGMNTLHDILARTRNTTTMRVSSIGWSDQSDRYIAIWSVNTGLGPALGETELNGPMSARLPPIPQGETFVMVETSVDYTPLFNVGIAEQTFRQMIVTRPRFAPQVAFDDGSQLLEQDFGPGNCNDGPNLCSPAGS
ncbi:TadE/TadG family type IV pilus assembly protein [Yoonia sp.]|uniref:TadE/TadG family type IV pilus assembly protein n=1 Tax=Yoonia sp. TaxID=2212373 RepID=UPI003919181B